MNAFLEAQATEELKLITCQPQPERWIAFCKKHKFTWKNIGFKKANSKSLPKEKGMYCFMVGPAGSQLPPAAYPLYAGITTRTLQQRFIEYVREKDSNTGRQHVRKFLNVFEKHLYFYYIEVDEDKETLEAIEKELNDALMPRYSHKDYSAEVKKKRNAFP